MALLTSSCKNGCDIVDRYALPSRGTGIAVTASLTMAAISGSSGAAGIGNLAISAFTMLSKSGAGALLIFFNLLRESG